MIITVMWPPELVITESMFRHYSGIAEVAGYLAECSNVVKKAGAEIQVMDCAVEVKTALNLASAARVSALIPIYINMNNIVEATQLVRFLKSVNPNTQIAVYGEAASCNPGVFAALPEIDYVIGNGQVEYALDYILCRIKHYDVQELTGLLSADVSLNGKILTISKLLPPEFWGMPALNLIPLDAYLRLSKGELHLLANKGCPFYCEFCNERIVSSNVLRYRAPKQVAEFLCGHYPASVRAAYLDASTFTYDRTWVLELCEEIQKLGDPLPWRTCTRVDCIDEPLIARMAESGCVRISVGVETLSEEIQDRNKKPVRRADLIQFAANCRKHNILPRALLIIGLNGQTYEDVLKAKRFCEDVGIDGRFRVLQDYSALIQCPDLKELDLTRLDRWNTWKPFQSLTFPALREIEYPPIKGNQNYV